MRKDDQDQVIMCSDRKSRNGRPEAASSSAFPATWLFAPALMWLLQLGFVRTEGSPTGTRRRLHIYCDKNVERRLFWPNDSSMRATLRSTSLPAGALNTSPSLAQRRRVRPPRHSRCAQETGRHLPPKALWNRRLALGVFANLRKVDQG